MFLRPHPSYIRRKLIEFAPEIWLALDMFEQDLGRYPSTDEGLEALVAPPQDAPNWLGPYIKSGVVPRDPWGHEYLYQFPGAVAPTMYDLTSGGPDGQVGTEDDISNRREEAAER